MRQTRKSSKKVLQGVSNADIRKLCPTQQIHVPYSNLESQFSVTIAQQSMNRFRVMVLYNSMAQKNKRPHYNAKRLLVYIMYVATIFHNPHRLVLFSVLLIILETVEVFV